MVLFLTGFNHSFIALWILHSLLHVIQHRPSDWRSRHSFKCVWIFIPLPLCCVEPWQGYECVTNHILPQRRTANLVVASLWFEVLSNFLSMSVYWYVTHVVSCLPSSSLRSPAMFSIKRMLATHYATCSSQYSYSCVYPSRNLICSVSK